jgi:hypothetical protein
LKERLSASRPSLLASDEQMTEGLAAAIAELEAQRVAIHAEKE